LPLRYFLDFVEADYTVGGADLKQREQSGKILRT
jgi:hypothetical protein